jgi:hypothetical protein
MDERQTTETQKQVVVTAICFEGRWKTGYLAAAFRHVPIKVNKICLNAPYAPEHLFQARIALSDECLASTDVVSTRQFAGRVYPADSW